MKIQFPSDSILHRLFQPEARVTLLWLAVGAIGIPALLCPRGAQYEGRSLLAFYGEFYGDIATLGDHWFPGLLAIVAPLILFKIVRSLVRASRNGRTRNAFRGKCRGWLLLAGVIGNLIAWPMAGCTVITWSIAYHPGAPWLFAWVFVFAIFPAVTLLLARAAAADERRVSKGRLAIRILTLFAGGFTAMLFGAPGGEAASVFILLFFALFSVVNIGAALGLAATLDKTRESEPVVK